MVWLLLNIKININVCVTKKKKELYVCESEISLICFLMHLYCTMYITYIYIYGRIEVLLYTFLIINSSSLADQPWKLYRPSTLYITSCLFIYDGFIKYDVHTTVSITVYYNITSNRHSVSFDDGTNEWFYKVNPFVLYPLGVNFTL